MTFGRVMIKLKRIGVLSFAKLQTVIMAFFGFIVGFFSIIGWVGILPFIYLDTGFGFQAIIFLPVLYAIYGFVSGVVGAFLYNLIAEWIGGIELEFEE